MCDISQEFTCKCGQCKGWITEGEKHSPCPVCCRVYVGIYNKKKLQIIAKEQKNDR